MDINSKRLKGVTLYGAIGTCIDKAVFMTGRSTNTEEFVQFLKKIVAEKKPTDKLPYFVYDNAPAHISNLAKPILQESFQAIPLPPYSCQLNSIETLWSHIKRRFKQRMC